MKIPEFKLRIEAMTLRQEFDAIMADIELDQNVLITACQGTLDYVFKFLIKFNKNILELKLSESLRKVLYVLLHIGNYLNHGAALGNAFGFKLSSLWKINELRATSKTTKESPRTLFHFVAQVLFYSYSYSHCFYK